MWSLLRKLGNRTLAIAAIVLILLAVAVGAFRLAVTQLPSYQGELQAWVNEALGVRLTFARLDARWGLRGPELTFREASVAASDDAAPFLTARAASVGLSPLNLVARLVARRDLGVDRLTLEGTELTLVKTTEGAFRLQGAPVGEARLALAVDVPPDVEVLVRDSQVLYLDESRSLAWEFEDVAASMRRDADMLVLEARARPPAAFGSRLEVTAQGFVDDGAATARFTGDWRLRAEVTDVDLAVAARLLPNSALLPQAGNGDVAVWLEWQDAELAHGTAELALAGVALPTVSGAAGGLYDRIALTADWQRDEDDWRLAFNDLAVTRAGRAWPTESDAEIELRRDAAGLERFVLRGDFLRLEDLTPMLALWPQSRLRDAWLAHSPRGDVSAIELELARAADGIDYSVAAEFAGLGIDAVEDLPGFNGVTGEVRADSRSGRVEFRSAATRVEWPSLFRASHVLDELSGIVVWREGQDAIRLVSDDLVVTTRDATVRSDLELTLPLDGGSPRLDLTASISGFDVAAVPRYLPARKMPAGVVSWLDDALRGGRVQSAEVTFVGPVAAFPFDGGEGQLRVVANVENAELRYVRDWPAAEELTGTVEFVNASFAARGAGRVLGNRTADVRVGIADLRSAVLTLEADTIGPLGQVLAFLQGAPLIARHLGPDFARLQAPDGTGEASVDLRLPLRDRAAYALAASLGIIDGELAFAGFQPHATEIRGTLELVNGELRGEGLEAIFLDGPVTARVAPPDEPGYRARLALEGETTIDAVASAFHLPFPELLAGQTAWTGSLLIPAHGTLDTPPARITVDSNLAGVALRLPAPFAKSAAEPTNLQVDMLFPVGGGLEIEGYLGATRRFALQFDRGESAEGSAFVFRRGALRFGGALPEFRAERGVTVDGSLPLLSVDDWLLLARGSTEAPPWSESFAGADLDIAEFSVFGQRLGSTTVGVRRLTDDWQIELDSDAIAGTLLVPVDLDRDPEIVAVMQRLYLNAGDATPLRDIDPRQLPGIQLHSDEFAVGARQLGRLDAEVLSDPLGLRLVSFESAAESFSAQGSGGWFRGADGDTTRFAVSVSSTDVAATLDRLGFDPFIEAEKAEVTASVYWPGPPSGNWMQHVGGDLALRVETGSLIDVEPGAGRVLGLMSISALPRRLALDFRDVFNRGLVFDEITADFVVIDGNAFTDNLKLTGPVAEIGVVGRTGLRDRDYRQQAVVTAEPGRMLPTVGGLLGGPGVAAALLIFTRIFKEPLKGIGQTSYCVTGSWQEPVVERLTAAQLEQGELCAELAPSESIARGTEVPEP
jgi:uncharacterized protein (TIGR02099 family)